MQHTKKTPRRFAKSTQLVFGEGAEDKPWLKLLRSLYSKNVNLHSKIDCGTGGSPKDIVDAAKRKGADESTVVIIDGDKPKEEYLAMGKIVKTSKNMKIIIINTCMEALLLTILNNGKAPNKDSGHCKSEFEKKYMDAKKRREQHGYIKLFPKTLLDEMRKKIPQLDELIKLFEGKT